MTSEEVALCFKCKGECLFSVLHRPIASQRRGVVIIVGGPQYRVGSHRQFVLLARTLVNANIPVLRFDYRGMGDSEGSQRDFEAIDADIQQAVDVLVDETGVDEVVLWGLCDAASAALFYAHKDTRVTGLVLLNPWVRSEQLLASTYLRHYYLSRVLSVDLWRKIFTGRISVRDSLANLLGVVRTAVRPESPADASKASSASQKSNLKVTTGRGLVQRMAEGLKRFEGRSLIILSGRDMTAAEFETAVDRSSLWRCQLGRHDVEVRRLPGADHTFSRAVHRTQVEEWTARWINSG